MRSLTPFLLIILAVIALRACLTVDTFQLSYADCQMVELQVISPPCYTDQAIRLYLQNAGQPIEGLSVSIINAKVREVRQLPNSNLSKGQSYSANVSYISPEGVTIFDVRASILEKEQIMECEHPVISIENLPDC